ncbi:MAG: glycosyltransferase family 39 protein [Cyanobacteria bacterium]|nr:glycosyltransferase family 39 protein [Cyanobacteriota bacterium]
MDEGYLNAPVLSMVQEGKIPHFDFEIAHPGLLYYFHRFLFSIFGQTIIATRYAWYVMSVLLSLIWFGLGRKLMSDGWAYALVFVVMATGPVIFVNSNNTWYSLFLMTIQVTLFLSWVNRVEKPAARQWFPVIWGVLSGVIFLLKQSLGIFSCLGIGLSVLSWLVIPAELEGREKNQVEIASKAVPLWLVRLTTLLPVGLIIVFITGFTLSDKPGLNWVFTVIFLPYFLVLFLFFSKLSGQVVSRARYRASLSALMRFVLGCLVVPGSAGMMLVASRGWEATVHAVYQCYVVTPRLFVTAFVGAPNMVNALLSPMAILVGVILCLTLLFITQKKHLLLASFHIGCGLFCFLFLMNQPDQKDSLSPSIVLVLLFTIVFHYFRWFVAVAVTGVLFSDIYRHKFSVAPTILPVMVLAHYAALSLMISFPAPVIAYTAYGYSFAVACLMIFAYGRYFKGRSLRSFFTPYHAPSVRTILLLAGVSILSLVFFTARGQNAKVQICRSNPLLLYNHRLTTGGRPDIQVSQEDYQTYSQVQKIVQTYARGSKDVVSFPDSPEIYFLTEHINLMHRYMLFGKPEFTSAWAELQQALLPSRGVNLVFLPAIDDKGNSLHRVGYCRALLEGLTAPPHFMTTTRQIVSNAGFRLRFLNPCFDVYLREGTAESKRMPFDSLSELGR